MNPPWEKVMYTPTMTYYRKHFQRVIARRRAKCPDAWEGETVPMIMYNAGAACLAAGEELNYRNVLNHLLPGSKPR
jgi:hypothetical protein